ncbi:MAG: nucleotide exchange factor GrpE, partial [Actinomycetota bacterium]|nr:nucleotide exchange factor GrpE [Actinomycetota bacterium]
MTPSDTSGLYGDRGRSDSDEEQPRVVIRDKRRIDPETGAVRDTSPASPSESSESGGNVTGAPPSAAETAAKELAERTEDLQRVSAEYANYRRRVDRDRVLIGQMAQERLVMDLLPVMDDLDRARD